MEREAITMTAQTKELLKQQIREAKLISFDIFDTLLFRKTNTPETVFDLIGKYFGIHGFRKMRMDAQNEASARAYAALRYPHGIWIRSTRFCPSAPMYRWIGWK